MASGLVDQHGEQKLRVVGADQFGGNITRSVQRGVIGEQRMMQMRHHDLTSQSAKIAIGAGAGHGSVKHAIVDPSHLNQRVRIGQCRNNREATPSEPVRHALAGSPFHASTSNFCWPRPATR